MRRAPPEAMIICVKKLLYKSAMKSLPDRLADAYQADMISRCIAAYFDSYPMGNE